MESPNCWDYWSCGREPGGQMVAEQGLCPVAGNTALHGVHRGSGAGRACWALAGTATHGRKCGAGPEAGNGCSACDFRRLVALQEGAALQADDVLAERLG